jgi:hypothetical protein
MLTRTSANYHTAALFMAPSGTEQGTLFHTLSAYGVTRAKNQSHIVKQPCQAFKLFGYAAEEIFTLWASSEICRGTSRKKSSFCPATDAGWAARSQR